MQGIHNKNWVLIHESIHAILSEMGFEEESKNENLVNVLTEGLSIAFNIELKEYKYLVTEVNCDFSYCLLLIFLCFIKIWWDFHPPVFVLCLYQLR